MELKQNNIILVGPMGAGKTTVGRILAEQLTLTFVDTDHEIEQRTGAQIAWIFEKEGEAGFRARESQALADVCLLEGQVIATGGGIVMREENRVLIRQHGHVIYLLAPLAMQIARTSKDRSRPLLSCDDPKAKLRELFELRDPLYREVADDIVFTHEGTARDLVKKIIQLLD